MKQRLRTILAAWIAVCLLSSPMITAFAEESIAVSPMLPAEEEAVSEEIISEAVEAEVSEYNVDLAPLDPDALPEEPTEPSEGALLPPEADPAFLEALENATIVCAIDDSVFIDDTFRNYVLNNCDYNGDGQLSDVEIGAVSAIDCQYREIRYLDGIEYFTALKTLNCSGNPLRRLDLSANEALSQLTCTYCSLYQLNLGQNTRLKTLDCRNNRLSQLDVSALTALETLRCSFNQLKTLDLHHNAALKKIDCFQNQLTQLDLRDCPKLVENYWTRRKIEDEYCATYGTAITVDHGVQVIVDQAPESPSVCPIDAAHFPDAAFRKFIAENIDTDQNGALSQLEISSTKSIECPDRGIGSLVGLECFTAMTVLDCSDNELKALNVRPFPRMTRLNCSGNQLTALDTTGNANLRKLDCSDNPLTALDLNGNPRLNNLQCQNTLLTELDIRKCPLLIENYDSYPDLFGVDEGVTIIASDDPQSDIVCNIDSAHFPDSAFRACVSQNCDVNQDGQLSSHEAGRVKQLRCEDQGIQSLKGLEWFPGLETLDCHGNQLEALDLSDNAALEILNCADNRLKALDVRHNPGLKSLSCQNNHLADLDLSGNPELTELLCANNALTQLDIRNCLYLLYCFQERFLKSSDADARLYSAAGAQLGVDALVELIVDGAAADNVCPIDAAHFPDERFRNAILAKYDVDGDEQLSRLESGVLTLDLNGYDIASLKGLEYFPDITDLDCRDNQLTQLDLSGNPRLEILHCGDNQLKALDLAPVPALWAL